MLQWKTTRCQMLDISFKKLNKYLFACYIFVIKLYNLEYSRMSKVKQYDVETSGNNFKFDTINFSK